MGPSGQVINLLVQTSNQTDNLNPKHFRGLCLFSVPLTAGFGQETEV